MKTGYSCNVEFHYIVFSMNSYEFMKFPRENHRVLKDAHVSLSRGTDKHFHYLLEINYIWYLFPVFFARIDFLLFLQSVQKKVTKF